MCAIVIAACVVALVIGIGFIGAWMLAHPMALVCSVFFAIVVGMIRSMA
jgi:hypothetical protein